MTDTRPLRAARTRLTRLAVAAARLFAGAQAPAVLFGQQPITAPSAPSTAPALDAETEAKLVDIDARAGRIRDYAARFEQRKYTALLRKPLVSGGRVRSVGSTVRWDTETPEPSVLFVDGPEVRTYYPKQKLVEVFPLDRRMADLVASPIPRLASLRRSFGFAALAPAAVRAEVADLPPAGDEVAVRLLPTDDFLRQHVREIRVLLDAKSALMLCVITVDADGDRTVVRVIDPAVNAGLKPADLALVVPPDARVSRPLDAGGGK
jgi:outer membrane lipoprotein-sorting protein